MGFQDVVFLPPPPLRLYNVTDGKKMLTTFCEIVTVN